MLLLAVTPSTPLSASSPGGSDWERLKEAQDCLSRHDFACAVEKLDQVDFDGEAGDTARQLRAELDAAMAARVRAEFEAFSDSQPLRWAGQRVGVSGWVAPVVKLGANSHVRLFDAQARATPAWSAGGSVNAGLALFHANLWLDTEVGFERWIDEAQYFTGDFGMEARWLSPLRFSVDSSRQPVLVTEESIFEHIVVDTYGVAARLIDLSGWFGELRVQQRRYSDDNFENSGYGWLLMPLTRGTFGLHVGYSIVLADTLESRWDLIDERYSPYFTPLRQRRHGPMSAVSLAAGPFTLKVKGDIAFASEFDPVAAAWGVYTRRQWFYWHVEGTTELTFSFLNLKAKYDYEHQIYYQYHQASLLLEFPIR